MASSFSATSRIIGPAKNIRKSSRSRVHGEILTIFRLNLIDAATLQGYAPISMSASVISPSHCATPHMLLAAINWAGKPTTLHELATILVMDRSISRTISGSSQTATLREALLQLATLKFHHT